MCLGVVAVVWILGRNHVSEPDDPATAIVPTDSNLLVITVDTLRADRLPAYGYEGIQTSAIDRLAREGILFRWAFTPVPLTLPAHSSLLTGLLPFSHGVRDNGTHHLSADHETLAELFKAHHYTTAAFVSAFVLDAKWGIAQGFDHFYDEFTVVAAERVAMAAIQRPAGEVWSEGRSWLRSHANEKFFAWLHFFDPHTPYDPPEPYKTRYQLSPYDGEVAYVDSVLAEVVSELEELGLLEKTAILLASDHGEGLGDHGEDEHGLLAYDSTLRVPWIMRFPNRHAAGTEIVEPVSLVDVFPTVVDLFGFAVPDGLDGVSRVRLLRGLGTAGDEVLYAESFHPRLRFGWSELTTLRTDRFKYIRAPRPELYEYLVDPDESNNLLDRHPQVAARLDEILTRMMQAGAERVDPKTRGLDRDAEQRLRSLGYLGGGANVDLEVPGKRLPDPKDKAPSYRKLLHARTLLHTGGEDEGVVLLKELIRTEPDLEEAHRILRDYWIGKGRFDIAVSSFRADLEREPENPLSWIDLGITYRSWNRPQEAMAALRRALRLQPKNVQALTLMGEILEDGGAFAEAQQYFSEAFEASPQTTSLLVQMAQMEIRQRRLVQAERLLFEALTEDQHISGAHYLLALIAEQRGNIGRAEADYRRELQVNPSDFQSLFNLSLLLGRRKAYGEQIELLESIPAIAPQLHEVHFYRAKAYLDSGDPARRQDAIAAAEQGLRLAPDSSSAPLGHYVLADVYALLGRREDAEREFRRGQELEAGLAKN